MSAHHPPQELAAEATKLRQTLSRRGMLEEYVPKVRACMRVRVCVCLLAFLHPLSEQASERESEENKGERTSEKGGQSKREKGKKKGKKRENDRERERKERESKRKKERSPTMHSLWGVGVRG